MDLNCLPKLAAVGGNTLNVEEIAGLEVAMMQRKLEENLSGKFQFWGKIFGATQDYLIVQCMEIFGEFPEYKYFYWLVRILLSKIALI